MKKVFLIEGCNFIDYPRGGQLSYCRQLLDTFPNDYFKLIGVSTNKNEKIGNWQRITIHSKTYDFFPLYYTENRISKGWLPERLRFLLSLIKYRGKLFENLSSIHIFSHAPESILALNINNPKYIVLHFMHGVQNPLDMPRYKWGKIISPLFWLLYLKKLNNIEYILAAADKVNIEKFQRENRFFKKIISFPTRYDDAIFKPFNQQKSKKATFVYCGRINLVKGWKLLINSFIYYLKYFGNAHLIIVGDGEDKIKLDKIIYKNNLSQNVTITGFIEKDEIVVWLNKAHVFLMPSYREGWSTSMIEALGCGLPIVSTNISAATNMIIENENGYILKSRNSKEFALAMRNAINLNTPNLVSIKLASKYRQSNLKYALLNLYPTFFKLNED